MSKHLFRILGATFLFLALPSVTQGVTMNFSGHFRSEGDVYSKLNLGAPNGNPSKAYILSRVLLNPKLVIDDHFSLNGQINLLQSNRFAPSTDSNSLGQGNGGFVFGDPNPQSRLNRVWLEWVSDFGVVRIGRMPISWGYGLIYDAGAGVFDDFQSTLDRLEYRLHFGHLVGAAAYSKGGKLSTLGNENDQEFYTLYLRYDNPEEDMEWGGLYERQVRSPSQRGNLATSGNPLYISTNAVAAGATQPPFAAFAPYPLSNNLFDVYFRRTIGYFTFGGEGAWLSGTAIDFTNNNQEDVLNAFGVMFNVSYNYHQVKAFFDFLYASGDASIDSDRLNGFALLHRNRRPGLILGRELLGSYHNSSVQQGSLLYYGAANSFSGAIYFRPGVRVDWSPSWASGFEVIVARKAATTAGEAANLGVEIDVGTDHEFYKNFDIGATVAYLFPGDGITGSAGAGAFGFRTTAAVKF